jgi:hypothetical protein
MQFVVLAAAMGCISDLRNNVCNQELVRKPYMGPDGMQIDVLD